MQVIENGYYEWLEYDLQPGNPETNRLVLLLEAPGMQLPGEAWVPGMAFNPHHQGWLTETGRSKHSRSVFETSAPCIACCPSRAWWPWPSASRRRWHHSRGASLSRNWPFAPSCRPAPL